LTNPPLLISAILVVPLEIHVPASKYPFVVPFNVIPTAPPPVVCAPYSRADVVSPLVEYVRVVLVSLIVTVPLVASTSPVGEPDLILTENVSAVSVVISAIGLTVNEPVLLLIVKDPLYATKSDAGSADPPLYDQYNVVPLLTFVVLTLNMPLLPSLMALGTAPNAYVGIGGPAVVVVVVIVGARVVVVVITGAATALGTTYSIVKVA
jgi:hypothetical protein